MAKTRINLAATNGNGSLKDLQAAAFILEERGQNSLLYNAQTIDYVLNSGQAGSTSLAWSYWAALPELRYVSRYLGNALSVASLYIGEADTSGTAPKRLPDDHPAVDLLSDFAGGYNGQSELLDRLALHLTVAGDSIIAGPRNGDGSEEPPFDQWRVYSTEEVYSRNGIVYIKMPGNIREQQIPSSVMAVRIWRPHPRMHFDADSPVKGSFSVLKELTLLDAHVNATCVSRLAGAGFLGVPEELDLPTGDMEMEGTEVDRFVALLTEVMGLAIKNRESAAALVPIILRGPAEYIDKIHHFDFYTEFAQQVPELRMGAIRRLALGLDIPPEILLGTSDSTSWTAFQVEDSAVRVHLIPLLRLITSSLTVGWLRPMLETLPLSDKQKEQIPNLVVHYDISNLKIRQDTSGDAEAMYDRFEIDADALRLAVGYGPDAAPDNKELAKQILLKLVAGPPEVAMYAVNALRTEFGIKMLPEPPKPPEPGAGAPTETPSPEEPDLSGPLPGERSQAKQTASPPIPTIGDQSNNAEGT